MNRKQTSIALSTLGFFASVLALFLCVEFLRAQQSSGIFTPSTYIVSDLGTLGGDNSVPIWVTNSGEVVGYSETGQFDSSGSPIVHAFRWSEGEMQDLGTLGGKNSQAFGANEEGQVAGFADVTGSVTSHAVLWDEDTVIDLGTLAGPGGFSEALQVNERHQVVGGSTTADGRFHAVLWDRGMITDLGTLGGPNSFGNGINDRGQIVGGAQLNDVVNPILGFPPFYPVLWENGEIVKLGPSAAAFRVNNKTQVVGRFLVPDPKERGVAHAFLWQEGVFIDLGVPAGDDNSEAISLNDHGQIVGDSGIGFIESYAPDRALLWQNGSRFDLNTLIPSDSGFHLIVAFDVNARGQIVVCAVQKSTGNIHAALLTPQPSDVSVNSGTSTEEPTTVRPPLSPRAERMLEHARRMKSERRGAME